ncbi:MAG TPA: YihY/virulence factor BrkB family protein [Solirubrobacteraceae bacterium]|jgi:membrane protein|nr:YihY/virulence factor BrkB family protein [Solirubrobacteraceae bacterium]
MLKRTFQKFQADEMTDHAAALTYFVMMSLFPALLVGISLLGLLGDQSLVTKAVRYARDNGAPPDVTKALDASLSATVANAGGAVSGALVLGIVVAIYGASGAFGGAGRALNVVYGVKETRGFLRHKLTDIAWTLVVIVLAIVALFSVFLGGGLAGDLFGVIGLGTTAESIWLVARWFVAIAAVLLIYAVAYTFAPNIEPRRLRWITPGAGVGVLIWLLASAGFFFYVSNFGKYGATYGAFAGAVILLLWLYLSNLAFLFGAELNAEREREQRPRGASPPPPTPQPPPQWPSTPSDTSGNGASDRSRVDDKYGRDALAR